jgi:hypothetical protein
VTTLEVHLRIGGDPEYEVGIVTAPSAEVAYREVAALLREVADEIERNALHE